MTVNYPFPDYGTFIPGARDLVATGSTQADAAPILAKANIFLTVAPGSGARLPTQFATSSVIEIIVINRGVNALLIYPPSNGQIEALGTNMPASVVSGGAAVFMCFDSTLAPGIQWWAR